MGLKEVTLCCCAVGLMGMGTFFTSGHSLMADEKTVVISNTSLSREAIKEYLINLAAIDHPNATEESKETYQNLLDERIPWFFNYVDWKFKKIPKKENEANSDKGTEIEQTELLSRQAIEKAIMKQIESEQKTISDDVKQLSQDEIHWFLDYLEWEMTWEEVAPVLAQDENHVLEENVEVMIEDSADEAAKWFPINEEVQPSTPNKGTPTKATEANEDTTSIPVVIVDENKETALNGTKEENVIDMHDEMDKKIVPSNVQEAQTSIVNERLVYQPEERASTKFNFSKKHFPKVVEENGQVRIVDQQQTPVKVEQTMTPTRKIPQTTALAFGHKTEKIIAQKLPQTGEESSLRNLLIGGVLIFGTLVTWISPKNRRSNKS